MMTNDRDRVPLRRPLAGVALGLGVLLTGCGSDAGDTWQIQEIPTDAEFQDICFIDESNGWMVGGGAFVEGGIVGRTRDGGRSWRFQSGLVETGPGVFLFHLNAVQFLDENRGYLVSSGGKILRTVDGGENWRIVRHGRRVSDHLFDIHFVDDQNGWAVGLGGVLRTLDGGEHWGGAASWPEARYLSGHAIHFVDLDRGWLVGQHGDIRRTDDGGVSWTQVEVLEPGRTPYLFALDFPDPEHGWVVGEDGTILHTGDGGETWFRQEGAGTAFLTAVHFIDPLRGWITGYTRGDGRSVVLGTTDGGVIWTMEQEVFGEELHTICVVDESHGWAAGDRVREAPQKLLRMVAEG